MARDARGMLVQSAPKAVVLLPTSYRPANTGVLPAGQSRSLQGLVWLKSQQAHPRINRQGLAVNVVSAFQQPHHRIGY